MARAPLLSGLLLSGTPLAAQQRLEIGVSGELRTFDSQLELATGVGIAGRLGYWIAGPLSLEGEATYARPRTDTPRRVRVGVTTFGGWLLLNQRVGSLGTLFLKGGYATVNFGACPTTSTPGAGPCGAAGVVQGGVGGRLGFTQVVQLRYEATVNRSMTTLKFANLTIQTGLALILGGRRRATPARTAADPCARPAGGAAGAAACPDSDGDGIRDNLDRCPSTPGGLPVDAKGCPVRAPVAAPPTPEPAPAQPAPREIRTWVLPGTVWPYRAAVLSPDAFTTLDSIIAVLETEPRARVEVRGYAYDRLIPADDRRLSQFRADAIRSYLTSKGIPVSRITAVGRGSEPLIDRGTTEESRTANRRVEIVVTQSPH
jgi:outer membrane protein OmpA-like peptidoglycan-associated protein